MIKSVSWTEYIYFMSGVLVIYYLYVGMIYYRHELRLLFTGKLTLFKKMKASLSDGNELSETGSDPKMVMRSLEEFFSQAATNFYSRTELINGLQQTLDNYTIDNKAFRYALENYISRESRNLCSIHLGEEDLRVLLKNR